MEVTVKLASGPVDVRFEIKRIHPSPSANTTARTCYAHLVTFSTKTPDELGRNCRSPMFSWSWLAFQGRFALARTVSTRCSSFSPSHSQTLSASQCFPFVLDFTSNRYSRLGRWFARYTRERLHTGVYRGTTVRAETSKWDQCRGIAILCKQLRCIGFGLRLSSSPYCLLFGSGMLLGPSVSAVFLSPTLFVSVPL